MEHNYSKSVSDDARNRTQVALTAAARRRRWVRCLRVYALTKHLKILQSAEQLFMGPSGSPAYTVTGKFDIPPHLPGFRLAKWNVYVLHAISFFDQTLEKYVECTAVFPVAPGPWQPDIL